MEELAEITAPRTFAEVQEVLAATLPGYARRAHQIALAEVIEEIIAANTEIMSAAPAIDEEGVIRPPRYLHGMLQGGTGTGKSLAALIPLILSGKRSVVATATKALQSQYAGTDLPFLQEHLPVPFTWAVIKGRANYVCHAQMEEVKAPTPAQAVVIARANELTTPQAVKDREVIDREDFPALSDEEWRPFSISSDECPGASSCPFGDVCFAERAKAKAADANVVITNTAYLLRDAALRLTSAGNVQLLGDMEHVIIDEGHTLPEVATSALEDTLGDGMIKKFTRDAGAYMKREDLDVQVSEMVEPVVDALWHEVTTRYLDWAEKNRVKQDPMPLTYQALSERPGLGTLFIDLYQAVKAVKDEILTRRAYEEKQRLARTRLLRRADKMMSRIMHYASDKGDVTVRWAQMNERVFRGEKRMSLSLHSAPVQVGPFLRAALWNKVPTILISATLADGNDFSYMARTVGLDGDNPRTYDAGTPFDYARQAVLFTPDKDQPDPSPKNKPAWRAYFHSRTRHLVEASGGGALLLFTSRTEMNMAYDVLAGPFRSQGLHVMRQGDTTTSELVRVMKDDGNAVLFALRTFFEGIDIQGSALRLVIMDKLPFAVPSDLVHKAREEALIARYQGDRFAGFKYMAVPEMTLVLTQGFGRLIRHTSDKGVVAIFDPRLKSKGYGSQILRKLPPARQTTDIEVAAEFLRKAR